MLKYERLSKENKVAVTYKNRTRLLSREFLLALGIAAALHISFVLLFKIKDFTLLPLKPLTFKMNVETDPASLYNGVSTDADGKENFSSFIDAPLYAALPSLAHVKPPLLRYNEDLKPFHRFSDAPELYYSEASSLEGKIKKRENSPLEFVFTGELYGKKHSPIFFPLNEEEHPGLRRLARFRLQIENKTGTVFWIDPLQSTGEPDLDKLAVNILQSLNFEPDEKNFVSSGEVEIHFNL